MNYEIDINAWTRGIKLPQTRDRLIFYLFALMDKEYQLYDWIEKDKEEYDPKNDDKNTRFHDNIWFAVEMIFDELDLQVSLDKGTAPYDNIGWYLKSREEAEALYEVAKYLGPMADDCYTNDEYLSYPDLEPMRKAAGEAFRIFMENEKDNTEFCEFIEDLKAKRLKEISASC